MRLERQTARTEKSGRRTDEYIGALPRRGVRSVSGVRWEVGISVGSGEGCRADRAVVPAGGPRACARG